ncbi:MAG: DUF3086 domain-containing protein [Synechococcaceae cyanobacterium]|nr:DUF3086 domain-containing protein [Synechococcaceae cyanobacterium]
MSSEPLPPGSDPRPGAASPAEAPSAEEAGPSPVPPPREPAPASPVASEPAPHASGATAAASDFPAAAEPLLALALTELQQRRDSLQAEIAGLEQRREQLQRDLGASFAGQSDAIARRLKGFQDYLVGALQDLAAAAERLELVAAPVLVQPSPLDQPGPAPEPPPPPVAGLFGEDETLIRRQLKRFQGQPDFQADPWKLRRTLDAAGAALLEDWFLSQGGRGAQASRGSRSRNALVTAAAVAILGELYGDRFQTLVLAGQPERLGEWRRSLQDALGLSREDFGPNSGIVLFERAEALVERADRLEEQGDLPFIVVDAAERAVDIPVLQFPLWIAYSASAEELSLDDDLA